MAKFGVLRSFAVVAALLAGSSAHAIPMSFEFEGTCSTLCWALGLEDGAQVTGGFSADVEGNVIEAGEVGSFTMNFGWFSLSNENSSIGAATSLVLNADQSGFQSGLFQIDVNLLGLLNYLPGNTFDFFANASNEKWYFEVPLIKGPGGYGNFTRVASVPEPATLSLLGAGLLAAGLASRRRRMKAKNVSAK